MYTRRIYNFAHDSAFVVLSTYVHAAQLQIHFYLLQTNEARSLSQQKYITSAQNIRA